MVDNALNFELARSVGAYFRLNSLQMDDIIQEVTQVTSNWKTITAQIGIARAELEMMEKAFNY